MRDKFEYLAAHSEEEQARKFYCGILKLEELSKPDSLAGRGGFWVQVEINNYILELKMECIQPV